METLVLDITRSISRARHPQLTGIDRVEHTYFKHFLELSQPTFFLAKVPGGSFVLDRLAARAVKALLDNRNAAFPRDLRARISVYRDARQRDLESAVRTLGRQLENTLKTGAIGRFTYFNVGHSNLSTPLFSLLRSAGCKSIVTMLHDTIPLDYPQYSSAASVRSFPGKLKAISLADLVVCNSRATAARALHWLPKREGGTALLVAHLGVEVWPRIARSDPGTKRFLVLGTIEPRKNHRLLLDTWRHFGETLPPDKIPHLDIVGYRGWRNKDVFRRLDNAAKVGGRIVEHGPLPDAEVRTKMALASALLFPSLAEGYGLPVLEALGSGLPVIASDLPVLRELAGDAPLYLPTEDVHSWAEAITLQMGPNRHKNTSVRLPLWNAHFSQIFAAIGMVSGEKTVD